MLKQFFEFRSQEGWRHVGERVADAVVRIVGAIGQNVCPFRLFTACTQ